MDADTIEKEIDDLFDLEERDKETMVDGHYYKAERYRNFVRLFKGKIFTLETGKLYEIEHEETLCIPCIKINKHLTLNETKLRREIEYVKGCMEHISSGFPLQVTRSKFISKLIVMPKPL